MVTEQSTLPKPPIVDLESWNAAIGEQHRLEDAWAKQTAEVYAARKRLPMTPMPGSFTFTDSAGTYLLADLFQGKHQLVVYHFMFGPDWRKGCPFCTQYMTEIGNAFADYLDERDTRFVLVSRAAPEKLTAWAAEKGITIPWYSGSTEFSEVTGALEEGRDVSRTSVLFRDDDGSVYRTYTPNVSGELPVMGDLMLQLTPYGRQVTDDEVPEGWPQPFSIY